MTIRRSSDARSQSRRSLVPFGSVAVARGEALRRFGRTMASPKVSAERASDGREETNDEEFGGG
jgi:hypothetical protein